MKEHQKDYQEFLQHKRQVVKEAGFDVTDSDINPKLFLFQRDIVRWALRLGKAALFEECGLGKTGQQLEWAKHVARHTGGRVLILAPLAVSGQTIREGIKFDVPVVYRRSGDEIADDDKIIITNYERLHLFDDIEFSGVVLDESSILKNFMGKTRTAIIERFITTPYKLACTATPAPNDYKELGNHSEFLGYKTGHEMLATWFVNDAANTGDWRLKKHAAADFWRWLTSWAVCLSRPGDLGAQYEMPDFDLPPLVIHEHLVDTSQETIERTFAEGRLIPDSNPSSTTLHKVKRESLANRVEQARVIAESLWGISLCGNQNTQKPEEKNTKTTLKKNRNASNNLETQNKTNNTCENTTKTTKINSRSIANEPKTDATQDGANDISKIQNIENSAKNIQDQETSNQSSTGIFNITSESALKSSMKSLNPKMESVQFADQNMQTKTNGDSTLTTITTQDVSGEYFAQTATLELESSRTISSCSNPPLNTYQNELTPVIVWCDTDYEQRALEDAFEGYAISVYGSLSNDEKENRIFAWLDGELPMLISKPSILGFGLNFQHCAHMIFVGVSFSFEKTYQALRRSYRFGQEKPVNAHMIYALTEGNVLARLTEKQEAFDTMQKEMNEAMSEYGLLRGDVDKRHTIAEFELFGGNDWTMYLGDCVPVTATLPDNSIDFSIYSPPFSDLFVFSDTVEDMSNTTSDDEFFEQYEYLIQDLYRVTVPGRLSVVHCKDLPTTKHTDGYIGLRDFPGEIIRRHEKYGWKYHSRITIWKNPAVEMQRTKSHALLHKNFKAQSESVRQGTPDYLIVFRKWPTDGGKPVTQQRIHGDYIGTNPLAERNDMERKNGYSIDVWERYASPVWFDIDQTNVLNFRIAKSNNDEKHIVPLQLDVIARSIDLWTNEGDTVFSPFAGVGSEGYEAIRLNRKFIGVELKRSYYDIAIKHLTEIERQKAQPTLFDLLPPVEDAIELTGD